MKRALVVGLTWTVTLAPRAAWTDPESPKACAEPYVQGQVLRNAHKLLEAREVLRVCARSSCKDFIVQDCSAWLDSVEANLPAVVPLAMEADGKVAPDVAIDLDGVSLAGPFDGRSFDVDPGPHTFVFRAGDGRTVARALVIREGDKSVHIVATFAQTAAEKDQATARPTLPAVEIPPPHTVSSASDAPARPSGPRPSVERSARRPSTAAIPNWVAPALGGLGAAGIGASAFFGMEALSEKNAAEGEGCRGNVCPGPASGHELKIAGRSATLANVFFGVGGAFAVSGVFVWIIASRRDGASAMVLSTDGTGISASGAW
ncbi:MAG: hypothetical protein ABSC94_06900 [Polyangiaceae bacterium]|jgi:hypothetical protein